MLDFVKTIPQVFYARAFYADLVLRGKGIGMRFILLQVFLSFAVPAFLMLFPPPDLQQKVENFFYKLPNVSIKGQKLSIDRPSPYVVDIGEGDKHSSIVFDTTPREINVAELEERMAKENVAVMVTEDFIALPHQSAVELYNFRDYSKPTDNIKAITHDRWIEIGKEFLMWGYPALIVLTFALLLVAALISTFFKALLVMLATMFFKIKPELSTSMRLSAAAGIPLAIFQFLLAVVSLATHREPYYALPYFAAVSVWFIFVLYGLFNAGKETRATAS